MARIGKPAKVFATRHKVAENITISTSPPLYGSLDALTYTTKYIIPGASFGATPRGRKSLRRELGYPGLEVFGGYVAEEPLSKLRGYNGVQTYEEMRRNDPIVYAMLFIAEQLIHNADLIVEPSEARPTGTQSELAVNIIRTSLFDMGNTWPDTLGEILSFLAFGWSVCSVWAKQRKGYKLDKWKSSRYTDNKWGWAGISVRSQATLNSWELDAKGRPIGMWQHGPPTWENVYIPFTHAAHFRTRTERDDPEGISVLRAAVWPWWYKKHLEEVEAIGLERDATGVAIMKTPEGVDLWNTKDESAAATLERCENIVRLMKVDKYQGVVLPFGYDLDTIKTAGQRPHNVSTAIERHNQMIAVTMLADMLLIGHERVGSFALVQSKTRLFSSALESYAARIAGVFNRELIPRLMMMNGIPQEYWPTLRFGPVETPSLVDLAEYIKALTDVGVQLPENVIRYLMRVAGFPIQHDDVLFAPEPKEKPKKEPKEPEEESEGEGESEEEEEEEESEDESESEGKSTEKQFTKKIAKDWKVSDREARELVKRGLLGLRNDYKFRELMGFDHSNGQRNKGNS